MLLTMLKIWQQLKCLSTDDEDNIMVCVCVWLCNRQSCPTLQSHGLWPASLFYPWNSSGKNAGVDSHSLLPGIFPKQGLNPVFCISGGFFTLSHKESLKWNTTLTTEYYSAIKSIMILCHRQHGWPWRVLR